jgi:hypothetical protein
VPSVVSDRRAAELRALGQRAAAAHAAERVGSVCDLVVMGSDRREGLTEDYLTVAVDAAVPRGTRCAARLELRDGKLFGVPIPSSAVPPRLA